MSPGRCCPSTFTPETLWQKLFGQAGSSRREQPSSARRVACGIGWSRPVAFSRWYPAFRCAHPVATPGSEHCLWICPAAGMDHHLKETRAEPARATLRGECAYHREAADEKELVFPNILEMSPPGPFATWCAAA